MKKIKLALLALAMPVMALAQGWPANYGGVMLQGFYWDSFVDSQWSNLASQADEMSCFKLIWVPQSGNCYSSYNQMGYTPVFFFDHNSSFGTEKQLRSMIQTFKQKGVGIIQDVVLNHHNNMGVDGSWVDFPAETYNGVTYQLKSTDICANDDGGKTKTWATKNGFTLGTNNDTGEDWDGCRDLDHKSANVKKVVNAYLPFLLNDLGYAGFRYDMVKGYSASFTGEYNATTGVQFSVGEYWDGQPSVVINWINGTNYNGAIQSAAFDFPFRYTVRDAVNNGDWSKLGGASVMSNSAYKRYAVTFIENHDTEYRSSAAQQDPIRKDTIAANAFMLAMPGTPCVFYKHWQDHKSEIKNMIALREIAGIHNMSTYSKYRSNVAYFANQVTGTNGKLMVVVGNTSQVTPSASSWVEVIAGHHYKYYLSPSCEVAWANVASGEYEKPFDVKLVAVSATAGAKLVYTLDGSEPTASSTQVASGTTVNISKSCTLKVGLLKNGAVSKVLTRDYQIVPFTPHTATIHLKDPSWPSVYFYMWDKNNKELNGVWPGKAVTDTKVVKGTKFYYKTVDITSKDYYLSVIFDKGTSADQTVDIGPIKNDVYYEINGSMSGKMLVEDITLQYIGGGDDPVKGDVNGDGQVNVSDVTALINKILGTASYDDAVCDINGDGMVNVSDVTALINQILG
ncbi:MAG: alpha-amylase family glycosyl hydrolase [Bacteroidales bacterium]|nr:alpha-amylase family glycosyl hydrolase [Bacteroidales bacterium]